MQLGAQHSQNLEAWFVHIPGLKVVAASNPYNAKGLLKTAIRDDNPVIFLEHELLYTMKGEVPDEEYTIPIGKADVKRQGSDVTILSYLRMAHISMNAAESLEKEGIHAEVIDLQSLRPLDLETCVNSLKKTHHLVVVEEDWPKCGMGAEIIASLQEVAFDYLDAPMLRVTAEDVPMPYSKNLERSMIPDESKVIKAVRRVMARYSPEEMQVQRAQAEQRAYQPEQEEEEEEEEQARFQGTE
jgi:pyruvate dehydrogenase E1 component beta subunit